MDLNTDELLLIALDTAEVAGGPAPAALEGRVLAAAGGVRSPRHPDWREPATPFGHGAGTPFGHEAGVAPMTAIDAFARTAADLADLLASLAGDEWEALVEVDRDDVRVRDMVVHVVGVERYVLGQLGRLDPLDAPRREDHWPVTLAAAAAFAGEPPELLARRWWQDVLTVISAAAELGPAHPVSYHHLTGSLRGLMLVRTFELWVHGDDVRRALGLPLHLLDEERLSLMSRQLMSVLPAGMALSGCPRPGRSARIELTGVGGGEFTVALAPGEVPAGEADLRVRVGTLELCRFAGNRLARADLDLDASGDLSLLEPILAGATAFAAD